MTKALQMNGITYHIQYFPERIKGHSLEECYENSYLLTIIRKESSVLRRLIRLCTVGPIGVGREGGGQPPPLIILEREDG